MREEGNILDPLVLVVGKRPNLIGDLRQIDVVEGSVDSCQRGCVLPMLAFDCFAKVLHRPVSYVQYLHECE
ncbi:hypothetical protein A4U94_15190 [Prescottella equi]|nr:hypothetical protein A4U94_15190 [Prescottella equi]ORL31393.1 hypothetical protein A6I91_17120 [Prescottella equi]